MVDMITDEKLFTQGDALLSALERTGEVNPVMLGWVMNSYDRLYSQMHREYMDMSLQYHDRCAQHSKRDAEFRRIVDKYGRLAAANQETERGPVAKLMNNTVKALSRLLPM